MSNLQCGWCNDERRFIEGCIESENHGCPIEGWYHQENEMLNVCPAKKAFLDNNEGDEPANEIKKQENEDKKL